MGTVEIVEGKMAIRDQMVEYMERGTEIEHMNLYDFMTETYEEKKKGELDEGDEDGTNEGNGQQEEEGIGQDGHGQSPQYQPLRQAGPGRPPNRRIPYKTNGPKEGRNRVIRTQGHETLLRFVGKWFPRNDSKEEWEKEFHAASMLALLKPWTRVSDIKGEGFIEEYQNLVEKGDKRMHRILHNIQYYYECEDGARKRREEEKEGLAIKSLKLPVDIDQDEYNRLVEESKRERKKKKIALEEIENNKIITEEDIEREKKLNLGKKEENFIKDAVDQGYECGMFGEEDEREEWNGIAQTADIDQVANIKGWAKQLKEATRIEETGNNLKAPSRNVAKGIIPCSSKTIAPLVTRGISTARDKMTREQTSEVETTEVDGNSLRMKRDMLNEEQRLAHDIVEDVLMAIIEGNNFFKSLLNFYLILIFTFND